jgi:hypothetical protein
MNNSPISQPLLKLLPGIAIIAGSVLSMVSITSCGDPGDSDSAVVVSAGSASKEDLIRIIEGGWVNVNYEEALLRVHSPMFAAEAGRPVQELMFDPARMKGDTMINGTGRLNYLEGERFDVVFVSEGGGTVMKIYEGPGLEVSDPTTLTYKIAGGDTMLCVVKKTGNDSIWFRRTFHKAPQKSGIAQNALEHFVNQSLFAGEWKAQDGSIVTFTADGKVSGWAKWTWFSVEIDKYGSEIQPDVMSAYNDKMGATYVYTLDNDRLSIYEYDSNSEDGMWTRGKMVAELTKKHVVQ